MKKILIDTDIGIDCDDAMAIAAAVELEREGLISLEGVSTCTAREGASGCAAAILDHYGKKADTAAYGGTPLDCDAVNVYAKAVANRFEKADAKEDSVKLLRRKLAASAEKTTLVSIGPLSVIAALIDSSPDEYSELCGVELIKAKVDELYAMAGNFVAFEPRYGGRYDYFTEWNVAQDVAAAKVVAERFPAPIVFSPFELGENVRTGEPFSGKGPVGEAIKLFYIDQKEKGFWNHTRFDCLSRSSWDPLTVCAAAGLDWFDNSPSGTVTLDDDGKMRFTAGEGNRRYLIERDPPSVTATKLNELFSRLVKNN